MYAIIEDSGSQFKVSQGDTISVDVRDLPENAKTITFDRVLLVGEGAGAKVGQPYVAGATVTADVLGEELTDKVTGYKFRRRKNYRRKIGHRQPLLNVKITAINA
jgi:large subunit ribosomal protein L21